MTKKRLAKGTKMRQRQTKQDIARRTPGPEPERLRIPGGWKDAVRTGLRKGKPSQTKPARKKKGRAG